MAKRFKEGSLDLEIPETQLVIDGAGVPVDIIRSERLFAHRLIEEMMLSANVAVAKFFSEKEAPSLFRIHEDPNDEAIQNLEKYLFNFGGNTKLTDGKLQKRLTKALQEFAGKPEAHILHILTLRSMAQAKYHQSNIGHFGLGFEHYTHFTSPIRRYPDLIVHRTLKSLVCPQKGYQPMDEEDLATAGTHLSACEQRSAKSERQIQAIKKARFMEKHLGEEFEGMVSSVVKFGVFVLLREYDIDGLIRLDDLGNDRWDYDEDNLRLVGKKSQRIIAAGDMMKIQVASADHELGQINFVPLEIVHVEHPKKKSSYKSEDRSDSGKGQKKRGNSDRFGKKSDRTDRKREDSRSFSKKRGISGDRFKKPSENEPKQSFKRNSQSESIQRPRSQPQERPTPRKGTEGPNLEVLKMILSPEEFAKVERAMKEQPVVSRKLQAAFQSRLPPQEEVESTHRKSFSKTKKNFHKEDKPAQKSDSKKSSGKSKKRRS
jgi:ribonuclease R